MNVDLSLIAAIAAIVCLAGIMQSAVGFAYALFATPVLVWMGVPLPVTIAIVSTCAFVQASLGARHLVADVPWRLAGVTVVSRLATTIVGVFILGMLSTLSVDAIKLVVGCVLCLSVGIQFAARPRAAAKLHWAWGALAFSASGLLAGTCGMGGPPLVIWALAHDWSSERTRGFLFAVFAASIPIQISLLYMMFGVDILWGAAIGLLLGPAVMLGTVVGLHLGKQISKPMLCRIAYAILLVIGLNCFFSSIL